MDQSQCFRKLAGRFHRIEQTDVYSVVACVGSVKAQDLNADDVRYIKGFYGFPPGTQHEIVTSNGNGAIKIYAE